MNKAKNSAKCNARYSNKSKAKSHAKYNTK